MTTKETVEAGLTQEVARFVATTTLDEVPVEVLRLAKRSILDGLALGVAGSRSQASVIVRAHIEGEGSSPAATMLGTSQRVSPRLAALANGLAIHADDYDDTQLAVRPDRVYGLLMHPTAPVLPAALALAETKHASGEELLVSYLVGVEVATKVAEAMSPRHYEAGFHSTATVGAIGAAAAAARMLGLSGEEAAICLGIAASQAAGLRENFGTMTKPLHAGRAAESGLLAAELAQAGFTAASTILEADRGFFRASADGWEPSLIEGKLGVPWTFEIPGISIKPHPCGSLAHPGMSVLLALIEEHGIEADDVERVTVGTNRHVPTALIHHRPQTTLEAKFSLEFCMAILLLERRAGLAQFTTETVRRSDVQELIGRVRLEIDPRSEARGYQAISTLVRLDLRDGRSLEARADFGRGSPQNPFSDEELVAKVAECFDWAGLPLDAVPELAARAGRLETEDSVDPILALVS